MGLFCLISTNVQALDYQVVFENDYCKIALATIDAGDEVGPHNDEYPRMLLSQLGGVLTRIESDTSQSDITIEPIIPTYLPADPPEQLHSIVNNTESPVVLTIIYQKA